MDNDKFNINKIIEEAIIEIDESDKIIEEETLVTESSKVNPVISSGFLGDFDIQANLEALEGLAEKIQGLPRVKGVLVLSESEGWLLANQFNVENNELTEGVKNFIKGENVVPPCVIPEASGLSSGIGALSFAKKLRRYQ